MKIIGLSIVRADSGIQDPIPIVMATDLSSYGFFQRQVSPAAHCKSLLQLYAVQSRIPVTNDNDALLSLSHHAFFSLVLLFSLKSCYNYVF